VPPSSYRCDAISLTRLVTTPIPEEAAEDAEAETADEAEPWRPSRRSLSVVAVVLIALVIMNWIGGTMAPTLVDTHPAVLLALNSGNRHLILTTNYLDWWSYYGLGMARLLVPDPLFFLLGHWYGDAAVTWMERRTQTWGDMLRMLERFFGKAAYPLVFLMPNNPICLFAGAAGMPLRAFFAINISGTIARLYVFRRFGEAFQDPIDDFVGWIGDHRMPLLVASLGLGLVSVALEAKKGETEVTSLANLDEELESAERELVDRKLEDGRQAD
jgi:membrane protein DedA with SNARE-associated domain